MVTRLFSIHVWVLKTTIQTILFCRHLVQLTIYYAVYFGFLSSVTIKMIHPRDVFHTYVFHQFHVVSYQVLTLIYFLPFLFSHPLLLPWNLPLLDLSVVTVLVQDMIISCLDYCSRVIDDLCLSCHTTHFTLPS